MKKFNRLMVVLLLVLPISLLAQPFVQFTANSSNVNCEENSVSINIDVTDFIEMNSFDISFHWDPNVISLTLPIEDTGLVPNIGKGISGIAQGDLVLSWFTLLQNGLTVPGGDGTILTLHFDLVGNASQISDLFYDNNPTFINIGQYGLLLNNTQYQLNTGQVTIFDNEDPNIFCPGTLTFDTNGANSTTITGAAPTTNDNCGVDFISYNLSGATTGVGTGDVSNTVLFEIGTTTVEYTVHDFGGNTMTCSFDVEITNVTAPEPLIIYMDNLTLNCENNTASINVSADNFKQMRSTQFSMKWDPSFLQHTSNSNLVFTAGFTSFGTSNIAGGELSFSWGDFTPLTLGDGTVLFTINFDIITPTNLIPVEFFENPALPTQFVSAASFPNQLPSTAYQLNDGSITLTDIVAPTISCPANVTINSTNSVDAIVNMIAPTANDNCAIVDTTYLLTGATTGMGTGDASGTTFLVGITTVEYTVTDMGGNSDVCSFQIEVTDIAPGVVTLDLDDLTLDCAAKIASINVIANDFTDMRSTQFNIQWNPALLEYLDTNNVVFTSGIIAFGTSNLANGELSFSWGDFNPLTLTGGTILFTINFTIPTPFGGTTPITFFENQAIPTQFVNTTSFPTALPPSEYSLIDGSVTLTDNEAPTVICPANVTIDATNGVDVIVNMIAPTANDNCTIGDTTYILSGATTGSGTGDASGTTFLIGTTTVEYTVTDLGGNSDICSFQVEVIDNPPGILTLDLDDLIIDCETNTASINVVADNFDEIRSTQFNIQWNSTLLEYVDTSNIVFTSGFTSFGISNLANGELSFSWGDFAPLTLTDGTILFTINFTINSPAGFTIPIQFFENPAIPTQFVSATSFPTALPSSEYELIDGSIFITDDEAPTLSCPADLTFTTTNGVDIMVNNISPIADDNCGILDTTYTLTDVATSNNIGSGTGDASGTTFPIGTTTVEYTVSDFDGNSTTCDFDITVIDPGIYTINIDSVDVDCNATTAFVGFSLENFVNVAGFQFTIEWDETKLEYANLVENIMPPGLPGTANVANGIFTYSWFGTSTTFPDDFEFIEIEFNILDVTVGNDYDIEFVTMGASTPLQINVQQPGQLPQALPSNITDYIDGNVEIIDISTPTLSCPMDVTINANGMASIPVPDIEATVSDDCGTPTLDYIIATTPPITGTGDASGNIFPEGTTMVTYTATDAAGNSVSCNFNVTVVQDPLMISCPANIDQDTDAGLCSAAIGSLPVTILSDPMNVSSISYEMVGANGLDMGNGDIPAMTYVVGTTTLVYTVTDNFGAIETCTLTVTINDTEAPVFANVPQDVTVECDAIPAVVNPTATDNCDGNVTVVYNGETNLPGGIILRTWSASDSEGNTANATQTITVVDTQAPVFSNIPQNVTVECDAIPPVGNPTATDNCDGNVNVIFNGETILPGGTIVRVWSTSDAAGNPANISQSITVEDTNPPTLSCPMDITVDAVSLTPNVCENNVTWNPVTAMDNCDTDVQVTSTHNSGDFFQLGTTIVTYFAVDDAGNIDSCKFNVTVLDAEAPVLTDCPTNILVPADGANCSASVMWIDPTVTDNCDNNITLTSMPASGSNFSVGTTPVTITATDASGNTTTCNFTVTVFDDVAPAIACPADITVSTNGDSNDPNSFISTITPMGCDSVILTFGFPLAADNCGVPTVVQTEGLISGSTYGIGDNIIEFVATDGSGNTDTCELNITITSFHNITAIATPDTICIGESTLLSVNPNSGAEWTAPDGTMYNSPTVTIDNATLSDSGTYVVIVTDPNTLCATQATVELVVLEGPDISIVANSLNCTDGTIDIPLTGVNNGSAIIEAWEWTDPSGAVISTDQNAVIPQAKEDDSGMYCLTATSSNGCSTTVCEEITITDNPLSEPTINSNCNGFICVGETCSLAGFFTEPDIDSVIWTVTDNDPAGGLPSNVNTNQISITPTQNGIYVYTYTIFSDGCSSSANVPLQVGSPASVEPDFVPVEFNGSENFNVTDNDIVPGTLPGTFTINVTSNVDNGTLVNNGDGTFDYTPDESYFGTDQFIYEICLDCNDQTICRWAIVTLDVTTEECLIPTVITPNDDGMNDALEITCVDQYPENELVVYNRWGDEVHRASPYNNDWNGTYNDQPLPDGTYFFVFLRDANDTDPQKGSLTIMR